MTASSGTPVAIVGMGALLPGSQGVDEFWQHILAADDLLRPVSDDRWLSGDYLTGPDALPTDHGGFLDQVAFNPIEWAMPPRVLAATDTTQLLALLTARAAFRDYGEDRLDEQLRERTSVILGCGDLELMGHMTARLARPVWRRRLIAAGVDESRADGLCEAISGGFADWQENTFPGVLSNVVAGRIAQLFDLHGTNLTIDAACGSALGAIATAVAQLRANVADAVLCGGVDTMNDPSMFMLFGKTGALSSSGRCRPFTQDADGTVLGEGLSMLVLRRLDDAVAAGERIYAVIKGVGSSSDGRGTAIYAPSAAGQARALRRAYADAGYGPGTVGLVEAHGTGTRVGDRVELQALTEVFERPASGPRCVLGSVKSQIGHSKYAAGATATIKAALALHHRVLPPTLGAGRADPAVAESPFRLLEQPRPWFSAGTPRRASVSAFGFGGSNYHLTLEEWQPHAQPSALGRGVRRLGADTPEALVAMLLGERAEASTGRVRVALVHGPDDAPELRSRAADAIRSRGDRRWLTGPGWSYLDDREGHGRIGYLFPGQGAQQLGMVAGLAAQFPEARAVWEAAATLDWDATELPDVVMPLDRGPDAKARLQATEWAQPALAAHSLALLALLDRAGARPSAAAGHSFGELVALHVAGAYDRDALLRLARSRGLLMAAAADRPSGMAAVAAGAADAAAWIREAGLAELWVVNDNTPSQVTVSGSTASVEQFQQVLRGRGVDSTRLDVAAAFHTPFVSAAADGFRQAVAGERLQAPAIDVYANTTARPYGHVAGELPDMLASQLTSPVRFRELISGMAADGVEFFVEVGPRRRLGNMVNQIVPDAVTIPLNPSGTSETEGFLRGLAALAAIDPAIELSRFAAPGPRPVTPPTPGVVMINGKNHGQPYPQDLDRPVARTQGHHDVIQQPAAPQPAVLSSAGHVQQADQSVLAGIVATQQSYLEQVSATQIAFLDAVRAWSGEARPSARRATLPTVELSAVAPAPVTVPPAGRTVPGVRGPVTAVQSAPAAPPVPAASVARVATVAVPAGDEVLAEVIAVVAERTGFPVAVVAPTMALEADLGVDSIKRVELVSAVEQRLGVGPSGLSSVVTVADLAGAFGGATTAPAPAARPGAAAAEPALEATAAAAAVPAGDEVLAEVIAVVAERTGFPVAVVAPTMALEADLGVDSIKRVELVSAVEQRLGVGPSGLSSVVTVADLAGAFGGTVAARTGELPPEPEPEVCDGQPSPLARLGWIAELADAPGVPMPGLEAVPVCVLADADDDASALVRRLAGAGIQVTDAPAPGGVLVMLGRATEGSAAEDVARVQHCVTRVQEALAAPVARLVLVDVLPPESGLADQPGGGVLAALGRCLALEEPEVEVLTWEVAGLTAADEVAAQVARELVVGAGTDCIRLAPGGRELTALRGLPADRWERVLNPHSVVVVSGGGRGITARIAQAMAGEYHCRFVLLGRTELVDEPAATSRMTGIGEVSAALARTGDPAPLTTARHLFAAREIRDCLSVIEASGGQARYFAVDVTDTDAVAAALAGVRADWGPVSAVVHGAGVLADNLVRTKDTATVDPVIRTKVGGLDALLAATRGDDLSLVVGFSSTSTARGNQGQSDYAIANALLEQRLNRVKTERPAALVRAVAWGPWAAGMVTLALAQRFTEKGIGLIDPDEGAAAMLRENLDARAGTYRHRVAGRRHRDARRGARPGTVRRPRGGRSPGAAHRGRGGAVAAPGTRRSPGEPAGGPSARGRRWHQHRHQRRGQRTVAPQCRPGALHRPTDAAAAAERPATARSRDAPVARLRCRLAVPRPGLPVAG